MSAPEMIDAFYQGDSIRAISAESGQTCEAEIEWLLRGYIIGLRSRQIEDECADE